MMNTKIIISFFLFIVAAHAVSGQTEERSNISGIIAKIKAINEVQHKYILNNQKSPNYQNYLELKDKATTQQLVNNTTNTNGVVACYVGWALEERMYPDLATVLKHFLEHDKNIVCNAGYVKRTTKLSIEFYDKYWEQVPDSFKANDKLLFSMDSVILYNDSCGSLLLFRAFENRSYPRSFNKQIAYLAFEKANIDAILYLCNWFKYEYKDQLKEALMKHLLNTNFTKEAEDMNYEGKYYYTLEELLKMNDPELKDLIVHKLQTDTIWKADWHRYQPLLQDHEYDELYVPDNYIHIYK